MDSGVARADGVPRPVPALPCAAVIIPCRNYAAFLGEALDSVFNQSVRPAQVIVVDDGSTDASAAIAASYGDRVALIRQPPSGAAAARNAGLRAARADCIAFLDADDLWPQRSLEWRLQALRDDPGAPYSYGKMEQFICATMDPAAASRIRYSREPSASRMIGSILVRRSALSQIGEFDETLEIGEGIDLVDRLGQVAGEAVAVDELVLRRRIHGGNTMLENRKNHSAYLKVLRASIRRQAAPAAAAEG
jgi:glycosyltransferase involved in cell wall biosynthesis